MPFSLTPIASTFQEDELAKSVPLEQTQLELGEQDSCTSGLTSDKLSTDEPKQDPPTELKADEAHAEEQPKEPEQADEQDQHADHSKVSSRRQSLRARLLTDLCSGDPVEAMAKANARLLEHDGIIQDCKQKEVSAQEGLDSAAAEVKCFSDQVIAAESIETEALEQVKALQKKLSESKKVIAKRKLEFQTQQDYMVLLEMEVVRHNKFRESAASMDNENDLKRQRIDELQRAVEDAKKAQTEFKEREREAKDAMRKLLKEQQQLSRLGPFGRRQRASLQAKGSQEVVAPVVDLLVPVKREVTQAFGKPRIHDPDAKPEVYLIEDSQ